MLSLCSCLPVATLGLCSTLVHGFAAADWVSLLQTDGLARGVPEQAQLGVEIKDDSVEKANTANETKDTKPGENITKTRERDPRSFRPGEEAEVLALEGDAIGQWVPCIVEKQEKGDTFTIKVGDKNSTKKVENVQFKMLRKIQPEFEVDKEIADGILLFWAAGSQENTIELVMQNIDHLRKTYKGRADVFLGHYDGQQDIWLNRDESWYKKNIQFSGLKNWKIKRTRPTGFPPQYIFAQEFLRDVLEKKQYRWVWLLDEDVDFRKVDLNQMFTDASTTKALIAAPTVTLANRTEEGLDKIAYSNCDSKYTACLVHTRKPECSYRYVNFIDMMFPLIHPRALQEMYNSCTNCLQLIDHTWCRRSARLLKKSQSEACAILDHVTIGFGNSRALKKITAQVNLNEGDARSSEKDDWVDSDKIKTFKCVPEVYELEEMS